MPVPCEDSRGFGGDSFGVLLPGPTDGGVPGTLGPQDGDLQGEETGIWPQGVEFLGGRIRMIVATLLVSCCQSGGERMGGSSPSQCFSRPAVEPFLDRA